MSHFEENMLYQHITNYQSLQYYEHFLLILYMLWPWEVGPWHQGMVHPQIVGGGMASDLKVTVSVLNKQSWKDEGWSSSLGVGQGTNNSSM